MYGPCWVPKCENEARQRLLVYNTDKSEGVWAPVCFECDNDSVPTFMLMWKVGEPHTPIIVPARFEPVSGRYVPLAAADHDGSLTEVAQAFARLREAEDALERVQRFLKDAEDES